MDTFTLKRDLQQRGFTLVEMITVVAFLAILMAIAIPNYLNFQKKAKEAEVRSNLGSIRNCFIAYYAESNNYNIGSIGTLDYTPRDNRGTPFGMSSTATGTNKKWDPGTSFSVLGFSCDSAVYFNYSLEVNNRTGEDAAFTAMASADLDANGLVSHFYIAEDSVSVNHGGDRF